MIFYAADNSFSHEKDLSQLDIVGYPIQYYTPEDQIIIGYGTSEAVSATTIDPQMVRTLLKFNNNRMDIYRNGRDVTCLSLKNIFKINGLDSFERTERMIIDRPLNVGWDSTMAGLARTNLHMKVNDNMPLIEEMIDRLAKINGIEIPSYKTSFQDRVILYCFPLLRKLHKKDTSFFNIYHSCGGHMLDGEVIHPGFREHSVKDALKKYADITSSKMIKLLCKRLERSAQRQIARSLETQPSFGALLNSELTNNGFDIEPSEVTAHYNVYINHEINVDIFNDLSFAKELFDDINHRYTLLENLKLRVHLGTYHKTAKFLKQNFTPQKILHLLADGGGGSGLLNDTIRQYNRYHIPESIPPRLKDKYPNGIKIPKNFKDIKELHDKISVQYNEIKGEDNNKSIPYSENEFRLHGFKIDNIELVLPSEGKTLVMWGKIFKNCVASYIDRAATKKLLIVGVKINGKLLYIVEVKVCRINKDLRKGLRVDSDGNLPLAVINPTDPKRYGEDHVDITQFKGWGNRSPKNCGDEDIRIKVSTLLKKILLEEQNVV